MMEHDMQRFVSRFYKTRFLKRSFVPGQSPVPVSGKAFDEEELINGVEAVLDRW